MSNNLIMFKRTHFLIITLMFVLGIIPFTSAMGKFGTCKCYYAPNQSSFEARYWAATSVVSAFVIKKNVNCRLCPNQWNRRNELVTYDFILYRNFKGPSPGHRFSAQAFTNPDHCGVNLLQGGTYLLNLHNPDKISRASHWKRGVYRLDACQSHWKWASVSNPRRNWLNARRARFAKSRK